MEGIYAMGGAGLSGTQWYGYRRAASTAGAVEPVTPVKEAPRTTSGADETVRVYGTGTSAARAIQPESVQDMLARYESDPAEMAARQRIQPFAVGTETGAQRAGEPEDAAAGEETKSAAEVMEEAECQTCARRKYQDGSDDPGVSFKTAAHIDPENAATVVRGHEMEHVTRERAAAEREGRKVVQQTVTLHTDICPECGKVYVSGGTTRTTTAAAGSEELANSRQEQEQERYTPFQAVA